MAVALLSSPTLQAVPITYSYQGGTLVKAIPQVPVSLTSISGTFTADLNPNLSDANGDYRSLVSSFNFSDGFSTATSSVYDLTEARFFTDATGQITDFWIEVVRPNPMPVGAHFSFSVRWDDGLGSALPQPSYPLSLADSNLDRTRYCRAVTSSGHACTQAFNAYASESESFQMTVTVPEPNSLTLLGLGVAGLGFARRKRNKA